MDNGLVPVYCEIRACWAEITTWCPLCEQYLCDAHDARHPCLRDEARDDE